MVLQLTPGVTALQWHRAAQAGGGWERLWESEPSALRSAGFSPGLIRRLLQGREDQLALAQEMARVAAAGATIVTLADADYPDALRPIPDPPLALYIRGRLPTEAPAVAVVGTRRPSLYGLGVAERLGRELGGQGLVVVSGLARGIDAAAHRGALQAGGITVAVLGSGLSQLYPPEHAELAAAIAERGAVVSEYPMETPPRPELFPRRNRLISGLSLGTVIVEAGARSGALITAGCALEQGREVFAVPGPAGSATSAGPHALLKEGARLAESVQDILEELNLVTCGPPAAASAAGDPAQAPLAGDEAQVLGLVDDQPRHLDELVARSGLATPAVSAALMQLVLARRVAERPGKRYVRG